MESKKQIALTSLLNDLTRDDLIEFSIVQAIQNKELKAQLN